MIIVVFLTIILLLTILNLLLNVRRKKSEQNFTIFLIFYIQLLSSMVQKNEMKTSISQHHSLPTRFNMFTLQPITLQVDNLFLFYKYIWTNYYVQKYHINHQNFLSFNCLLFITLVKHVSEPCQKIASLNEYIGKLLAVYLLLTINYCLHLDGFREVPLEGGILKPQTFLS